MNIDGPGGVGNDLFPGNRGDTMAPAIGKVPSAVAVSGNRWEKTRRSVVCYLRIGTKSANSAAFLSRGNFGRVSLFIGSRRPARSVRNFSGITGAGLPLAVVESFLRRVPSEKLPPLE